MTRAMTMLNQAGDVTLVWTEEQDDMMAEIIAKKMAEGVVFFLIEPRLGGMAPPALTTLANPADALRHRALAIPDADFAKLVGAGVAVAIKTPDKPVRKARISRSPKEVASGESVGVRRARGG